jgi:diguanylate cyclase (GGDEF)-like protein
MVVLSGLASFLGSRLLIGTFRDNAVHVEHDARDMATLRAEFLDLAVDISTAVTPDQLAKVDVERAHVDHDFDVVLDGERSAQARQLFEQARTLYRGMVTAVLAADPTNLAVRSLPVSIQGPQVLKVIDLANEPSLGVFNGDFDDAEHLDRIALAVIAGLVLSVLVLVLRLARRLSTEVLRPVGVLRDSANSLADGELDHRVVVDRADELGDLAVSFNAMADAIAGSQRQLRSEATTDSLTGLPNRAAFHTRLEAVLAQPERRPGQDAVMFVDLDDFKDVNDTLGHAAGDQLLREVAGRLAEAVRPGDLVARLGGDEFAVLLDGLPGPEVALTVAERIVAVLAAPVELGEHVTHVGASVGLALRADGSTFETLMRQADVAMYAAKGKGKNRVEQYDGRLDEAASRRLLLKGDVVGAAERGELVAHYQPVIDLQTGRLVGVEALVRWLHPALGLLPPGAFIEVAEETGAIRAVGGWVLETATRQVQAWRRHYGLDDLWLSVNVSVCQLEAAGFVDEVAGVLAASGLDPAHLVIEVTESLLADSNGGAAGALTALRRRGVRVALDDFGTGYSSIGYLRRFPVDVLKIDRSFVSGPGATGSGNALLEAIVAMARHLGLDVIPEGIEEPEQLLRLRALGCRIGQGFLLARPTDGDAIDALLAEAHPAPLSSRPGRIR